MRRQNVRYSPMPKGYIRHVKHQTAQTAPSLAEYPSFARAPPSQLPVVYMLPANL